MEKKRIFKDQSISATVTMIAVLAVLCILTYMQISTLIKARCIQRMEEGVNTVIKEVTAKFERDSDILNASAKTLSQTDNFDIDSTLAVMEANAPLLETMKVYVLLPDNRILSPDGSITDNVDNSDLSFETEAPLGEHISNRSFSIGSGRPQLRHFVPIIQDGQTAALLYGVTYLDTLPESLNIDNIYNASANAYIIDTRNGDFILDTFHSELGNISEYGQDIQPSRKTKGGVTWQEYTDSVMNLETGYVIYRTDTTDGWEYMYYSPSGINQWSIAVSVPEREALSNLFAIRRIFLLFAILLTLCSLLYYLWVRRNSRLYTQQVVEQAVLKEKLHKAEAAERAKTMFLSNMSHDIRTPMNAIIGFTTLAEANIDDRARVQEYLAKILSSSNHLLSLINDVLDMSRIESGKLNIEETECSISDIFRDMRNIIQTQMQSKQLNFFMDTLDVTNEKVYCDKLHMNQVLLNLLGNSVKFTPVGGSVSLTVSQHPGAPKGYGAYEIRVKDTGIGMSKDFQKRIFEPFERERTSTVSGIQGTGLGMPITKSIIDAMGGTIAVESEEGKGTEFIINIELRLADDGERDVRIRELEGLRALVVDDNFTTCDSVSKMLMQIGMRSEWTRYGKEAVLRAKQAVEMGDEFYAYIIDWAMPDLNGIEVARQIRAMVSETVPIIILTAYDLSEIKDELDNINITAMCSKPLFMSELCDTLIAAIGKNESAPAEAPIIPETTDLKGKRLLLVEDNELNREIAVEILKESGFEVETAEDGTVAVELVKASEPGYYDLILMDVQMPIMNGYEATKEIRALDNKELAEIPIVAMTANAFDDDRREALKSGMNAHIAKPINVAKLTETIETILKKSGSADK